MCIRKFDVHKFTKRILELLSALFLFVVAVHVQNYIYVNPDDSCLERILWHDFYEDNGRIDNVYLGSSHVFCALNPTILDDVNGQYNFNLATPGQLLNGTYYILREANRNNDLKHVYVELYYYYIVKEYPGSDTERIDHEYFRNWQNTDYMRMSMNKLRYMLAIADSERYADICLPFVRYRENVGDKDYIRRVIGMKQVEDYNEYKWQYDYSDGNGQFEFRKQGYYYTTRVFPGETKLWKQNRSLLDEKPLGQKSEQYLREIIRYCQQNDLAITLFVAPINQLELLSTINYDNYVTQIKSIANEYDVPFYDFNLVKEEYLPIQQEEYFMDNVGHLNASGAEMFTPFFYKVVSENESDNMRYFYSSYAEKLQDTDAAIYGLYYRESIGDEESEPYRTMNIASNKEDDMEYRVLLLPEEGEPYLVQDYSDNREFIVSSEEHGICTITARMKGEPDEMQTLEIIY